MRQHADGVLEIVGPVIEARLEVLPGKDGADIVGHGVFGLQVGVSERIHRLVRARFGDIIQRRRAILVQFVHGRDPKRGLQRPAKNQVVRRLYAHGELGVEAAHDFVKFVVRRNLGVEPRPYRKRNLGKEPMDRARIVVGIIAGGERIGTYLVPAPRVAGHRARIRIQVGGIVRRGGNGVPAELIPDRIRRQSFDQAAAQYGVGHEQLGRVLQVQFFVNPVYQRRAVRKMRGMVGIHRILESGVGLRGMLVRIAERIVIHARALPRRGAIGRAQPHAGGRRPVYLDAHAAIGAAETAEGEKLPVGVFRRQIHVVGSARVANRYVQLGGATAERLERMVDRGGNPLRTGCATKKTRRSAVAHQAAKEIPIVFKACVLGSKACLARVRAAEGLPTGIAGRHDLGAVVRRNRRIRWRSPPFGRLGMGPKPFETIIGPVGKTSGNFPESPDIPALFDQVIPGRIAETAGNGSDDIPAKFLAPGIKKAPLGVAMGGDQGGDESVRIFTALQRRPVKSARIPGVRPAARLGIRSQGPRPLFGFQLLAIHHFRRKHGMRAAADAAAPDGAGVRIAGVGVVLMGGRDLQPLEIAARHEIGDARHRVRSIHGGSPFLQHLYATDRDGRHRIHVHETTADEAGRDIYLAAPIQ